MFALATFPGVLAAIPKATADGPRRWRRHRTWNGGEPLGMTPNSRHRAEQAFGVRMMGRVEEAGGDRLLHDFTGVHHDYTRAVFRHYADVLCYDKDGSPQTAR